MNPIVLITGGSRGIGAATALLAAQKGYAVAVNYTTNSLAADEIVRQIRHNGGTAITVQADVGVEAQVMAMFEKVDAKLGAHQRAGEQRRRGGRGLPGGRDECGAAQAHV